MTYDFGIVLHADSPEAQRGNELARQLVTARAQPAGEKLWHQALNEVVAEALGFDTRDEEEDPLKAMVTRFCYLASALAVMGAAGVWAAARTRNPQSDENGAPIELPRVLQEVMQAVEQGVIPWI